MLTQRSSLQSTFLREWLEAPFRVGAVVPSGRQLAAAMTDGISATSGPVIELGAGTGVFTGALLRRGIEPHNLASIELGTRFVEALRDKYPSIHLVEGDARNIQTLTPFAPRSVEKIICGLPLLSMPNDMVEQVLSGSFEMLRQDGVLRLFTYGPQCPVSPSLLWRFKLRARKTARSFINLPPATVYELRNDLSSQV